MYTVSFAVSMAAMLLIPITIVSHEIMVSYPNNQYIQWLNRGLIFGEKITWVINWLDLWNVIFLGANLSLFVLIPFGFFYNESDGFAVGMKGIILRFYQTMRELVLVAFIIAGIIYLVRFYY